MRQTKEEGGMEERRGRKSDCEGARMKRKTKNKVGMKNGCGKKSGSVAGGGDDEE